MKTTEYFRRRNNQNRILLTFLALAGIAILLVVPAMLVRLKLSEIVPANISMPPAIPPQIMKTQPPTYVFILDNDHALITTTDKISRTEISRMATFFSKDDKAPVLVSTTDKASQETLKFVFEVLRSASLNYSLVDFNKKQVDSLLNKIPE
jgi:hypothetical protein